MGIKKPSKSKLRRLSKRAVKDTEAEPVEEVTNAESIVQEDDEAPEAVPLEQQSASDVEDDANEISDNEEEEQQKEKKELVPRVNEEEAMIRITNEFKLKKLPWIETLTVTSSKPIDIPDIKDDMTRELAFYEQALEAVKIGREKVLEAGLPFSRPDDYFAEMIKSEEHMAKVRQKLLDESAQLKASEDAKRQRLLKKYGKKVQVEKQLERQKQKTDTLEKIKLLKRKRKDAGTDLTTNDDFDIALEGDAEKKGNSNKKQKTGKGKGEKIISKKREAKNAKYGMGGKRRNKKSNTAESSAALGNFNKMKGKPIYLSKAKSRK
ncbi:hypothetical protein INT45_012740 [Circinella minor]|uniref:rRNA-processing protein EBP2 n=1 Tax=Circinella minor TaxID=1195481 RepID=A0A8H7VM10_9FUNG|nr:hypothetical protein INT45_012740 [Circinella minor]